MIHQSIGQIHLQDLRGGTDTIRKDDGCNEQAAQAVLKAIDDYNKNSNGVVSGDLMEYEGPCCKEYY